jgi:hypothetical protein
VQHAAAGGELQCQSGLSASFLKVAERDLSQSGET